MENEENQEQVFHRFPPPLEIAARFPHSHSRGDDREEKWKSKSRIPTFPSRLVVSLQILERRILLNAGSAVLQAHPSIRKCWLSIGYRVCGRCLIRMKLVEATATRLLEVTIMNLAGIWQG